MNSGVKMRPAVHNTMASASSGFHLLQSCLQRLQWALRQVNLIQPLERLVLQVRLLAREVKGHGLDLTLQVDLAEHLRVLLGETLRLFHHPADLIWGKPLARVS